MYTKMASFTGAYNLSASSFTNTNVLKDEFKSITTQLTEVELATITNAENILINSTDITANIDAINAASLLITANSENISINL
jgi:hypothetical protein